MPHADPPLRLALVAPPCATVPPDGLGGYRAVRDLAAGLAARGHQVVVIGAGVGAEGLDGFRVVDTDPLPDRRADPAVLGHKHAVAAGEALAGFPVDVVADHTRTGVIGCGAPVPTAWVAYDPAPAARQGEPVPAAPEHVVLVAVSTRQASREPGRGWRDVIGPAVSLAGDAPSGHRGACLFVGPVGTHARMALDAAHAAGEHLTLVEPSLNQAGDAYAEVELRPRLWPGDRLLRPATPGHVRALLGGARCLLAPLDAEAPTSLAVLQALAAGTPVVGLWDSVAAELVVQDKGGALVLDPADLGQAVRRVLRDRLAGDRVRATVAGYDLPVVVAAWERLLGSLAAGTPRAAR